MQRNLTSQARFSKPALPKTKSVPARVLRRRSVSLIGAVTFASVASPAIAEFEPKTKLVRCGEESCLQVSGYRKDPASVISLNGHVVPVEGENGWRVRLPVETVRELSAPHARQIEVSLRHPDTAQETSANAELPIGLLGDTTTLDIIEVRAS